jgi:MFS superfamily sulfate permease-like transporter
MIIDKQAGKIKLTKGNVNTIAFSEFFAKSGIKWVLGMVVVALLLQICRIFLASIPLIIAYVVFIGLFIWMVLIYTKKQNLYRKGLWQDLKELGFTDVDE